MARKHCSYCYQLGHTRPTCPEIRKEIRANPNGYQAQTAERKAAQKAQRGPTIRRCSYCKESGHNKKTCTTLRFDRVEHRVKNKKFAKAFIEGCKQHGLYPGALLELQSTQTLTLEAEERGKTVSTYRIRQAERDRTMYGSLAMVMGFNEQAINSDLANSDKYLRFENCVIVRFPNGRKSVLALPREFRHIATNSEACSHGLWQMGCPVDASKILNLFSEAWKSGDLAVDRQLGLEK